jgi:hypothetical protein
LQASQKIFAGGQIKKPNGGNPIAIRHLVWKGEETDRLFQGDDIQCYTSVNEPMAERVFQ